MNQRSDRVRVLYDRAYAEIYDVLYRQPWPDKHRLNVENVGRIADDLGRTPLRWLDTCCGQAWCFSQFRAGFVKLGVDVSAAQLQLARSRNADASFVRGDVTAFELRPRSFDLVTNFWASYCYLETRETIRDFFGKCISWIREGGALYFELLLPEDLEGFNASPYSRITGYQITEVSPGSGEWTYVDVGGTHRMTSPPLEDFTAALDGRFRHVEARHDGRFMVQLIARGRC